MNRRISPLRNVFALLAAALVSAAAAPCPAATFDWSVPSGGNYWPAGSTAAQTYNNVGGIAGLSLTVTIGGNTNRIVTGGGNSPVTSTRLDGGAGNVSLFINLRNLGTNESVTVTFAFSSPVQNVGMDIYDIDKNAYTDRVTVEGKLGAAATYSPSVATPGVTNKASGNGALEGTAVAADKTSDGNGHFAYAAPLDSLRITYQNLQGGGANQWIGIHGIVFTPVPEPTHALLALAAGAGAIGLLRRRLARSPAAE